MMNIQSRTRIKMCGMTREEDILSASALGVDALGFVFYPPSPRAVDIKKASALVKHCSPLTSKVALFVDPERQFVLDVINATGVEILQFHGNESVDFCSQFNRPFIKALRVNNERDTEDKVEMYRSSDLILLDSYVKGVPGGTGTAFDWSLIPSGIAYKLMLAGGLNSANVSEAINAIKPYAVDVSGGIEDSPGIKSAAKMSAFVAAVKTADLALNEISS